MVLHHIDDVRRQLEKLCGWTADHGYLCVCDLEREDESFHREETVPHHGFDRDYTKRWLRDNHMDDVSDATVCTNRKTGDGSEREYPVLPDSGPEESGVKRSVTAERLTRREKPLRRVSLGDCCVSISLQKMFLQEADGV